MGIGEGLLQGILGGVAGGAGQVLQRNQMMDKEDETGRLEQLRADIQLKREKAIADYKVSKEQEIANTERGRVAGIIGGENQQSKQLREQGGDEFMPDNFTPSGKSMDEQISAATHAGDMELVGKLEASKVRQAQMDHYAADSKFHDRMAGVAEKNADTRGLLGSLKMNAPTKYDPKAAKEFMEEHKDLWKRPGVDGKDVENADISAYIRTAYANGLGDEVRGLRERAMKEPGVIDQKTGDINEEALTKNMRYFAQQRLASFNSRKPEVTPQQPSGTSTETPNKQTSKPSSKETAPQDANEDKAAERWANQALPRFDTASSDGNTLGSGAMSFFKNLGIAVDVNNKDSVFNAINEIDQYIPRLKGDKLKQAMEIRQKLMAIK